MGFVPRPAASVDRDSDSDSDDENAVAVNVDGSNANRKLVVKEDFRCTIKYLIRVLHVTYTEKLFFFNFLC